MRAPAADSQQMQPPPATSRVGEFATAVFLTLFTCFWNAVLIAGLGSSISASFYGTCHSSNLVDGTCTNGDCSEYSDDGGGGYRRRVQDLADRTMADVRRDSDSCALNAAGSDCAVPGPGDCSFSKDPYTGVFLSLFALPFVAAGVSTAVMAVRAWMGVLPCCASAARTCDGCAARDRKGLGKVAAALGLSSFAIGWNSAIFMMLLPQIPQLWHDSIGLGVFLCIFSIPFLGAGVMMTVQALAAWAEVCPCLNTVGTFCPGLPTFRSGHSTTVPDSEMVVQGIPAAAEVVVAAEPFDNSRSSHAAAAYLSAGKQVQATAPLLSTV